MLVVLRIAGIIVVFVTLASVLLFFLTRDGKYLRIAYRVFQYAALVALALLLYLALERVTEMF